MILSYYGLHGIQSAGAADALPRCTNCHSLHATCTPPAQLIPPPAHPPSSPACCLSASPSFNTPLLQVVDPQLDALAHTLLKQLRQLDGMERAGAIATAATLAPLLPAERALAATGLQLPTLAPVLGAVTVTTPAAAADPSFPALPDTLLGTSKPVRRLVGGLREVRAAGYVQADPNSAAVQLLYSPAA